MLMSLLLAFALEQPYATNTNTMPPVAKAEIPMPPAEPTLNGSLPTREGVQSIFKALAGEPPKPTDLKFFTKDGQRVTTYHQRTRLERFMKRGVSR